MANIDGTRHPAAPGTALTAGRIGKTTLIHKFGAAESIGTSLVPVTSSKTYQTPQTAQSLEIVSTDNTNDVAAGAGARTVRVIGIKAWADGEEFEDVTLTGTTPAAIPGTWLRVYRLIILTSGTYATQSAPSHNSVITVRNTGAGVTWAVIERHASTFGFGQSEIACYSIPTGYTAYLAGHSIFVDSGKSADCIFFSRESADDTVAPYQAMNSKILYRGIVGDIGDKHDDHPYGPFVGPCDIGWLAASTSTTSSVSIEMDILLIKD